jgi:iron complex outermembrane receptor protein
MGASNTPLRRAFWIAVIAALAPIGHGARAQSVEDLQNMSIDQLANIDVSSVTKARESLSDAPAAIYVITHDDIVRSGATSVPEILRLAPNLFVAQTSASTWVITARGFSGNAQAQNFSDKLLVLIDGRTVYSPLFSGVYWDMQDVLVEDIDRIEVISGPGATLWGANAVNGVINIITRKSSETQGGLLEVGGGNLESEVSLRYGGKIGPDLTWRVYAKDFFDADTVTSTGAPTHDNWSKPQGGFRFDWTPASGDAVSVQGDAYQGYEAQQGAANEDISGADVLARWNHAWQNGATLQVQAYWDRTERSTQDNGGGLLLNTFDLDLQNNFSLGARNSVVVGAGFRIDQYRITNTSSLLFAPPDGHLDLANVFVQDSVSLARSLTLILGVKLEDDPYSGLSPLPSVRLSWKPADEVLLWAAVSRAIRSPTPFDTDVVEKIGPIVYLVGNPDFRPESLIAYEIGARAQPTPRLSFSVSTYYNA